MRSIPRRRRVVSTPRPVAGGRRSVGQRRRSRAPVAGVLLLALAPLLACSGAAWQGARLYRSGTAALDRGDLERSVTDLERAAALLPEKSEIHNHLGIAYVSTGRLEEAVASFERAAALDCTNDPARENLRVVRARLASRVADPQTPATTAAPREGAAHGTGAGGAPAQHPAPMPGSGPRGDGPEAAPPAPSDAGPDGV